MALSVQRFRGTISLVGPIVDNLVTLAQSSTIAHQLPSYPKTPMPFHITLITKDELRSLDPDQVTSLNPDTRYVHALGLGGLPNSEVYWIVVIWAAGQQVRKRLGLPPKDFHITLSAKDVHEVHKGIKSLLPDAFPADPDPVLLDHLIFTLHAMGQYREATDYGSKLVTANVDSPKGFLRLADAFLALQLYKLAMLSYVQAYERSTDDKARDYCINKLIECSKHTEWGHAFQEHEAAEIQSLGDVANHLLVPWSHEVWDLLSQRELTPVLYLEPRDSLYIPKGPSTKSLFKLPRFFRWLIPHHLAIMSTPRNEDDIDALSSPYLGIRHVLTLTEETPLPQSWFAGKRISNTFLPVPNFHPPSIEQMDLIVRLFDDHQNLPLLVHCGGGKGRAGTVAACYLAAFGFKKPRYDQDHPELAAADAISRLRALRPGSLETAQQEAFVSTWCSIIWKRQSVYPDLPSEPPPCPVEIEGTLPKDADLFIMVGLPGSGKSWFSNSLLARDPTGWLHISQDASGSRASCETEIGRNPKRKKVLLDRCNTSAADRKIWLALASTWAVSPVCILFDYDRELCTARAQMRAGHPTLPPGSRVRNAIQQMERVYVRPTLSEGFKAIVVIRSFSAAEELIRRLSPPAGICKFPRTPHLLNVGAATADDVHAEYSSFASASMQGHTVITEKIDGANMGFSLSDDRSRILVQNRSHYVNPSTHEQFKKLGVWLERHEDDLRMVLDRDPYFAERYILYGEWMFATHSIPYTNLPDLFIAYDLYDRTTRSFVDSRTFRNLLKDTSIHTVPLVHEGEMPTDEVLLSMIQASSQFYDGRVEGVYVKVETNGVVRMRGKVVRSDFIAGNEHWTKGNIRANGLRITADGD
ncbi:ATP dependent DNA ligase [Panaeolus papilionaceus]|nr:ATP dependent DNA ligase [Panaeolus papilionaceus]